MKDKYYIHYRTKNIYRVVEELLVENPTTKFWEEGVLYEEAYYKEDDNKIKEKSDPKLRFVRSKERFERSFEEVNISDFVIE